MDGNSQIDGYVSKINKKLILDSYFSLSQFNIKDGFQFNDCYVQLDKNYNQNDNFKIFIAFKHIVTSHKSNLYAGFVNNDDAMYTPYVSVAGDNVFMVNQSSRPITKPLASTYQNKHLMLWFTKKDNTYHLKICDSNIELTETISSVKSFQSDRFKIDAPYHIKRIGFSSNNYESDSYEFVKIKFLEKSKGTYFVTALYTNTVRMAIITQMI